MPDYQNSRIYKIIDLETNECYIGSTTIALSQRLAQHVSTYKSYLNGKSVYVTSFKIIANGNYDIVLIELFPCNGKEELHSRESDYCQSITCVNKIKNQGLYNALCKMEYIKQYREQHKNQHKQYYIDNNEHLKEYSKQYTLNHKDQIKLYREEHKEQINNYQNTVIYCQCGRSHTRGYKTQHERTNKHKEYEQNKLYYDIRRGLDMIKKLDDFFYLQQSQQCCVSNK
jgi:hypothetical protein